MGGKILICISKRGRGRRWTGLIWTRGVMSCRQVETHRHLSGTGSPPPFAVSNYSEDGDDMLLRNVGEFPTDNAAPHPKRQYSAVIVKSQVLLKTGFSMWAVVNAAVNLLVPQKAGTFWETKRLLASREKERLLHGVFIQVENENSAYREASKYLLPVKVEQRKATGRRCYFRSFRLCSSIWGNEKPVLWELREVRQVDQVGLWLHWKAQALTFSDRHSEWNDGYADCSLLWRDAVYFSRDVRTNISEEPDAYTFRVFPQYTLLFYTGDGGSWFLTSVRWMESVSQTFHLHDI